MKKKLMLIVSCLFFAVGLIYSQTVPVNGVVVDEQGIGVIGATVVVKGTTTGIGTDLDGKFSLNVAPNSTLVFSSVGFQTVERAASQNMRIVMEIDRQVLGDVVVVAYGTAKKEALTGSVAAISADDIAKRPSSNLGTALEGMGAGIQVNTSFGEPGSEPTIRIRGFSSLIGNNDPLIILDGVTYTGRLSDISPDDIENISVLKDAASAALYGSRASNGVVMVTTKRAKKGEKSRLNLTIRQGLVTKGLAEYDRLGTHDFMNVAFESYENGLSSTLGDKNTPEQIRNLARENIVNSYLYYNIYNVENKDLYGADGRLNPNASILPGIAGDLDWFKPAQRTGYRQDYNISGVAGGEQFQAHYSLGYLDEEGYVKQSDFSRFTGRMGVDYQARKWLKVGATLSGSYSKQNQTFSDDGMAHSIFNFARIMAPIYPVHRHDLDPNGTGAYILDENGNRIYDTGEEVGGRQGMSANPIWSNELNYIKNLNQRTSLGSYATISFLKDFDFTVRGNLEQRYITEKNYDSPVIGDAAGTGRLIQTKYNIKTYTFSQELYWKRTFAKVHNLDVLAMHEAYAWNRILDRTFKSDQIFDGIDEHVNFATMSEINGYTDKYRLESYLGRIRYNYDEKYFGEVSYRRDGSSIYQKGNRWGNFWAVGASWIISREKLLEPIKEINMLKFRTSYGEVGNDGFGGGRYYMYLPLYMLSNMDGQGAVHQTTVADPTVSWESMNSFGVALEGRIFDRVNFSVEYFKKKQEDLLMNVPGPTSLGGSANWGSSYTPRITRNIGDMENYGWELAVDADVVKTKDWRWNVGFDITWLNNKITKLAPSLRESGVVDGVKKWTEGRDLYEFYLTQWAGVDQMTGQNLYLHDPEKATVGLKTINGVDYTTLYSEALKDYSGSSIADATGTIRTSLSYKNFDLSFLFTYGIGGKFLDFRYASYMTASANVGALHKDLLNSWKGAPEGMTENSPNRVSTNVLPQLNTATSINNSSISSSRFLKDASYLSFKNITLNYRVPDLITKRLDLTALSLSGSIENIALFSRRKGMNPIQNFSGQSQNIFVPARVFSLSINVTL